MSRCCVESNEKFPAFDVVRDPFAALEDVIGLGFARVLTSGLDSSALEGAPTIRKLVEQVSEAFYLIE